MFSHTNPPALVIVMSNQTIHIPFGWQVVESDILAEIEQIIATGSRPSGQAAREYYSPGRLGILLHRYFAERGIGKRGKQAQALGVSVPTLTRIYDGADISENMLFRFQVAVSKRQIEADTGVTNPEAVRTLPWRDARDAEMQGLVADLVETLSALMRAVQHSNEIGRPESGINEMQKTQIVSVLKQAIAAFDAPVVNTKEASGALRRIKQAIGSGSQKAVQGEAKELTSAAIEKGQGVIGGLLKRSGWETFTSFF